MPNRHKQAVTAALRAGDVIGRLIAQLGTAEHPRGAVLVAYNVALRALRDVLTQRTPNRDLAVTEVLAVLRQQLRAIAQETLAAAQGAGTVQAQAQLTAAGVAVPALPPAVAAAYAPSTAPALNAWLAVAETQMTTARALLTTGGSVAEVIGDAERAGVLRAAPVLAEGSRWLAQVLAGTAAALTQQYAPATDGWLHQAVAGLDSRTTQCCLLAHGQVQPLDKPFHLTGTPHYAEYQMSTPFHNYCRSAVALVSPEDSEDSLTQEMVEAAQAELKARENGSRARIYPVDARSKR